MSKQVEPDSLTLPKYEATQGYTHLHLSIPGWDQYHHMAPSQTDRSPLAFWGLGPATNENYTPSPRIPRGIIQTRGTWQHCTADAGSVSA